MLLASHQWCPRLAAAWPGPLPWRRRGAATPFARLLLALVGLGVPLAVGTVPAAAQPGTVGQWGAPIGFPFAASHAALLRDGRVLLWNDLGALPQIWNPANGTFASAAAPGALPGGMAQANLKDGRLILLGGVAPTDSGLATVWRYNVIGNVWQSLPTLITGRDEATAVLLGDGRALAVAGDVAPNAAAAVPELAQPGSNWVGLTNASRSLPRRPWCFLLANGMVAVAGPERTTRLLDVTGNGDWSVVSDMLFGARDGGTAVLVPGVTDRVMILGGRSPATPTCEIIDLSNGLGWRATASMSAARRHHQATILADGSVLVTGGTLMGDELQYAVYAAERFNPVLETWTDLDSMAVPRRNGSVALLLPDARVLVAGGGTGEAGSELHANAEIFSPPYLFKGARPLITAVADSMVYGDSLTVNTPDDSIAAVWLVRAGTVSAGFNADQRALSLGFLPHVGNVRVAAPNDHEAAPPGHWLLYLVHASGAPSLGRIERLVDLPPPLNLPVITSSPGLTASLGSQYVYVPTATGPGPITWSLTQAPAWLIVNSANGIVTGIPTAEQSFAVTLRATNSSGFVQQSWNITATGTVRKVIAIGSIWRYFKGTTNPGSTWANLGFNDSSWLQGASGFGFGDSDDATVLTDMQNNYATVYTRRAFTVYEVQSVTRIAILYDYDDGFAVYLNGTRIFDRGAPATITNTSLATSSHEAIHSFERQEITTPATLALLQEGQNVLAVVGLNNTLGSNDVTLRIELELVGGSDLPVDAPWSEAGSGDWVFPNPFQDGTHFRFGLQRAGAVRLELFDVRGRRLRTLLAPGLLPGMQHLQWDGRDEGGEGVVPGVYFYRLLTPDGERRGKLVKSSIVAR